MGYVIKRERLAAPPDRFRARAVARAQDALFEASAPSRLARDRRRIAEIAVRMAERILGAAVDRDPALLDVLYDRAVAEMGSLRPGKLRVHPEDRRRTRVDELAAARGIEVVEDASVGRGGCAVEACGTASDHSVEAVLEALRLAAEGRLYST